LLVFLVLILGAIAAHFFLGAIIKRGVETAGPIITKVDVKLDQASLGLLTGTGELKGLGIGNPEGYKAPSAIQVGSMRVQIVPKSLFGDKVIVHSIKVVAPELTFEGGLQGNNLSTLLDNIRGSPAKQNTGTSKPNSAATRKIQVDDILVSEGKINLSVALLGSVAAAVPLPEIHLSGLGQGPDGITAAELSERLLKAILDNATKAVAGKAALGASLTGAAQNLTGTVQQVEKAAKGLGDLFKGKLDKCGRTKSRQGR